MRDLHLRLMVRLQSCVEHAERHEAETEHLVTETTWELPHLLEHVPTIIAALWNR